MALVINSNVASLNVQSSLNRSQSQMRETLQRLSSGLQLNSARRCHGPDYLRKDDGAGHSKDFVKRQGHLAAVNLTGYEVATDKAVGPDLNTDLDDFLPFEWPNVGPRSFSSDRIVMHELIHVVMLRSVDMQTLPLWFVQGTAESIYGADARLNSDLVTLAGASRSRVQDADYAQGMSQFLRNQIPKQAGISRVAQANSNA